MLIYAIYTGIGQGTLGWLFLQVLTLIFLWIGLKTQNFVPTNISYVHYGALEFVDPIRARKLYFKPNRRKMHIPANNYCHPKVLAQIKVHKQLSSWQNYIKLPSEVYRSYTSCSWIGSNSVLVLETI